MLRRKENYTPDIISVGRLSLNKSTYQIICDEKSEALSAKEFQVLEMLMLRPGMTVSAEQILTHIWGWNAETDISSLWVHISNLRKKLDKIESDANIRFVRGAGYILESKP